MNKINSKNILFLFIVFLALLFLNLNTPLWWNMTLGFSALEQSAQHASFPNLIYEADYIRGFVYKLMLYGVIKINSLFTTTENYYLFQLSAKTFYYLICFSFSFVSFWIALRNKALKEIAYLWLLFWTLLFSSGYRQFMEAEELAVIFTASHFLFIYSSHYKLNFFSGVFIFLLFGCKAITLLYTGFGLLYLLFFCHQNIEKIKWVLLGHLIFGGLTLLAFSTFLYPEVENIITAMGYQKSLQFEGLGFLKKFLISFIEFSTFIPLLFFIPIGFIQSYFESRKKFLFYISITLLASSCVLLQNRFSSPYHYLAFIPVSLYVCFNIDHSRSRILERKIQFNIGLIKQRLTFNIKALSLSVLFLYTFFQSMNNTNKLEYASNYLYRKRFLSRTETYAEINHYLIKKSASELLFLSGEQVPYFIRIPNASERISSIVLNRSYSNPSLKNTEEFKSFHDTVLKYTRDFIMWEPGYLNLSGFPEIQSKLNSDYIVNKTFDLEEGEKIVLFKRKK